MEGFCSPAIWDAVDQRVRQFHAAQGGARLAVGVVRGGRVVRSLLCGEGVNEESVFRIASMTKSFTACAVLRLRDQGKLRLDDEAVRYVPQMAKLGTATSDAAPITVRHLLSMGAGLATDDPWGDRLLDVSPEGFSRLLERELGRYAVAPGDAFEYSNLGYALLGRVIAAASGQSFQAYISEHVLRPLGMLRTTWVAPAEAVFLPADGAPVLGDGEFASMGGLFSCIKDLAIWVDFLQSAFPARNDSEDPALPLCRASRREMQRVHQMPKEPATRSVLGQVKTTQLGYGFGIQVSHHMHFGTTCAHSGGLPGYGSHMRWWFDGSGVGLVGAANKTYAEVVTLLSLCQDDLAAGWTAAPLLSAAAGAPQGAAELADVVARLLALANAWSDAHAQELFSFNVFLDHPDTRTEVEKLAGFAVQSVKPLSWTRTEAVLSKPGVPDVKLLVLLAPLKALKLQYWKCTPVVPILVK